MLTRGWAEQLMLRTLDNRSKTLDGNTKLERRGLEGFAIVLHGTDVVTLDADGAPGYTLNSGGWRTVATKDRINVYSPVRIVQRNGIWYVGDTVFTDGMRVGEHGQVLMSGNLEAEFARQDALRAIDSTVRDVLAHVRQHGLGEPGSDDTAGLVWGAVRRDPYLFRICQGNHKRMAQMVRRYLRDRSEGHTYERHA